MNNPAQNSNDVLNKEVTQTIKRIQPIQKTKLGLVPNEIELLKNDEFVEVDIALLQRLHGKNIMIQGDQNLGNWLVDNGFAKKENGVWMVNSGYLQLVNDVDSGKVNQSNINEAINNPNTPFSRVYGQDLQSVPAKMYTIKKALESAKLFGFLSQGPSVQPIQKDSELMRQYNNAVRYLGLWVFNEGLENNQSEVFSILLKYAPNVQTKLKGEINSMITGIKLFEAHYKEEFSVEDNDADSLKLVRILSMLSFIQENTKDRAENVMIDLANNLVSEAKEVQNPIITRLVERIIQVNSEINRPQIKPLSQPATV